MRTNETPVAAATRKLNQLTDKAGSSDAPADASRRPGACVEAGAAASHPVTFRWDLGHEPDLTLVPGLGSLVRHSECSDEWLDTKGTCYLPCHAHMLPS